MSYSEYINGPAWAAKKRQFKSQRELLCECCKDDRKLDVHHLTYERLYNEAMGDLMLLCRKCHEAVEQAIQRKRLTRKGNPKKLRAETIAFLRGYLSVKPTRRPFSNAYIEKQHAARIAFHKKRQEEIRLSNIAEAERHKARKKATNEQRIAHQKEQARLQREQRDWNRTEIRSAFY